VNYRSPEDALAAGRFHPVHKLASEPPKANVYDERNPKPVGEARENGANKFKLVRWGESAFDPNEEWRIKHIMPMKGVGLIYGKSQSLKSFVAMHLALAVAMGELGG
jgi:hypothetical protein